MTIDWRMILLDGGTLAAIVFGALAVFSIRRWFIPAHELPRNLGSDKPS